MKIHELYVYNAIRDALLNSYVKEINKVEKTSDFSKSLKNSNEKIKQRKLNNNSYKNRGRR